MSLAARAWIRRLSTAALAIVLIAIVVLIAQRFRKLTKPITEVFGGQLVVEDGDPAVGLYNDFEFVERVADKIVFALTSSRTLGRSSGWHELEGFRLQFYPDGEPGPVLTCEGARFNIQTRDALLEGRVQIEFPDGAVLTTDAGHFEASSHRFTTDSQVFYISDATFGRARRATYDLERDKLILSDGVVVRTGEGLTLMAPLVEYERDANKIIFPDGCRLQYLESTVEAPFLAIELEEGGGPPQRLELSGGVTARGKDVTGNGIVEAWTERAIARRDGKGNWQIKASTDGRWVEIRFLGGVGFYERRVKAWILRAVVGAGGILNVRGENGVCISEIPIEGSPRYAEGKNARIWFDDGQATDVELVNEVVLRADGVEARGFRARVSSSAGVTILDSDPTGRGRVVLISDRGRVNCDQVQIFNDEGRAEALGNIQGGMTDVSLLGKGTPENDEPLHFAAGILDLSENGAVFNLRDNARLWQGHRMLLADEVHYDRDAATVRASGHVRTTFPASQLNLDGKPDQDVVVVARSLDYEEGEGTAIYRGNVRYSDPEHTLAATELAVFFNQKNEVTAIEAIGSVELVDLVTGRRMTGRSARRDVRSQIVTLEGSPVQLTDPGGNTVSGSSLTWDQANGTVTVTGNTETVYYPEETP
ncbi:MAG: LptA/OstA family protein [Thermoanaerobaculales bacterium]